MSKVPFTLHAGIRIVGHLLPALAVRAGVRLLWRPTVPAPVQPADRHVHDLARRGTLRHRGVDVSTYAWGDPRRPAVLLVHGWRSRASALSGLITALTDAGLRVVAFDAPGHGDSRGDSRGVLDIAEIVQRLTEPEQEPWAGIVGHALGALGAGVAVREGVPTRSLVGIATPSSIAARTDAFVKAVGLPPALRERFAVASVQHLTEDPVETLDRFDLAARPLPASVPAMWIHDVDDPEVPYVSALRLYAAHSGSSDLLTTFRLGHDEIVRDPTVHARVLDHLKRTASLARYAEGA